MEKEMTYEKKTEYLQEVESVMDEAMQYASKATENNSETITVPSAMFVQIHLTMVTMYEELKKAYATIEWHKEEVVKLVHDMLKGPKAKKPRAKH